MEAEPLSHLGSSGAPTAETQGDAALHERSGRELSGWINRLARIDRHRTLVDGACYLAEFRPALGIDLDRNATLQWGSRVVRGPVTDVARISIVPWDDDAVVKFNPRSGIDPEIDQWSSSPFWGSKRFGDRVAMLQIFVAGEIAVDEYDCKGTSRREDMLTYGFRQECDARGSFKQPERAARTAEQWSAPAHPTPTTLERINADVWATSKPTYAG